MHDATCLNDLPPQVQCEATMSELQDTQASNSKAEVRERERAEAAAAKEVAIRASYDELKMAQELCEQAAQELERAKSDGKAIAGEAAKRAWKEAQEQMEQVLLIDCTYQEQMEQVLRCDRLCMLHTIHCRLYIPFTAHRLTTD
jgi:hypothetical protein